MKKRDDKQKASVKPSMTNPAGPVGKTEKPEGLPRVSDDTRVIHAEECGVDDG